MSNVSLGIGLATGLDIESIVTQLMAIERRPLENLQSRVEQIVAEQTAFDEISAYLLQLQLTSGQFTNKMNVFSVRDSLSSNESVMTSTVSNGAAQGSYTFTVKSIVQSHQLVSAGFAALDTLVGAGTVTIEVGNGNVDRDTWLDSLNGSAGVATGSILVTDRLGNSATIDLSGTLTAQDVVDEINSTDSLGVVASLQGDSFHLADITGSTLANLSVQEVAGGATAADLGLLGSVAADTLTGDAVVSISGATTLASLNDSRGLRDAYGLADFRITRRDGVTLDVDISTATTLQDVLDLINDHASNGDAGMTASISADGTRLELNDSTGGPGDLVVAALNSSGTAEDLGILSSITGNTLTGQRVVAEFNTVLLTSLAGGGGVPDGSIEIENRLGSSRVVDLTQAETLSDVIDIINASGAGVTASVNSAGTGLRLVDTTGGAGTLSVTEVDSTTAAALGILGSVAGDVLRGANVQLQYISEATTLSTLNGGAGVYAGRFQISDRNGYAAVVDLSQSDDNQIADVISEINSRGIGVVASLNATGDGILLTDVTGGTGDLKVIDLDGGTTARDLNIAGTADEATPDTIDGSFEYTIDILATDTLQDLVNKIKGSGAHVSAGILNDGSATDPYRLSLVSRETGSIGRVVIDTGALGIDFTTTQQARDAVVLYGESVPGSNPIVITSNTNNITGIVEGLTLELESASEAQVTISVTANNDIVISTVEAFVSQWNQAIDAVQLYTSYNPDTKSRGLLLGDQTAMRIEDRLNRMISHTTSGISTTYNRLSSVGVAFAGTGNIVFNPGKLRDGLAENRADVEALFSAKEVGLGAYFVQELERVTDERTGMVKHRNDTLDDQIAVLQSQIENLAERLASEQQRLYRAFYAMEEVVSTLKIQQSVIDNMPNFLASKTGRNKD